VKSSSHNSSMISASLAALNLAGAVIVIFWSYLADVRQVRPSTTITLYYIASILLNITFLWSLKTIQDFWKESTTYIALICSQVILCTLENRSKENYFVNGHDWIPPESTKGILNRTFFWWMKDLFIKAANGRITSKDMFNLSPEMQSSSLSTRIIQSWGKRR
jgi:ATP-binding cassette, subfamily C (CFTR/MRP), member 1